MRPMIAAGAPIATTRGGTSDQRSVGRDFALGLTGVLMILASLPLLARMTAPTRSARPTKSAALPSAAQLPRVDYTASPITGWALRPTAPDPALRRAAGIEYYPIPERFSPPGHAFAICPSAPQILPGSTDPAR